MSWVDQVGQVDEFNRAVEYLSTSKGLKLSNNQKLLFYGKFKQATVGDVNTSRPGMLDFVGRAKW